MLSRKKPDLKKVLIAIIIVIVCFATVSLIATKVVYDSIFTRYDCAVTDFPKAVSETVSMREEVGYPSGENMLSGYLYRSRGEADKNTLIVLATGHNACSDSYIWQIHELLELGWSVLAFDSTGCCKSEGKSTIGFPQELCDMRATLDYLKENNNLGYGDVVLLGHSRGGYAACCALSYGYDVSAVVSVSGVNSAMEGIMSASVERVGPVAYANYGFLWLYQTMLFGSETVNMRADRVLKETDTPVLLVHGEDDTQIPADKFSIMSYKDSLQGGNVEFIMRSYPSNAGHTNLLFDDDGTADDELIEIINNFLLEKLDKVG